MRSGVQSLDAARTNEYDTATFLQIRGITGIVRFLPSFFLLSALTWGQTCVPVSTLRPVDSLSGSFTDSDCRLSDGSIRAEYVLTLPTFGQLQLNATSTDFDVTLFLRDAAGRKLESGPAIRRTIERGE